MGDDLVDQIEVGRGHHQSEVTPGSQPMKGFVQRVLVGHFSVRGRELRDDSRVQLLYGAAPRSELQGQGGPVPPVGHRQHVGVQSADRLLARARQQVVWCVVHRAHQFIHLDRAENPMDGTEEQRGVVLVDQHRQATIPARPGIRLLKLEVGGVPVVAVGDHRTTGCQSLGYHLQPNVAHGPDTVLLLRVIHEGSFGRRFKERSDQLTHNPGPSVDQQDRGRVQAHLRHSLGQVPRPMRIDTFVRQYGAPFQVAGPSRRIQGTDQPADSDTARGVLMKIDRRKRVAGHAARGLPAAKPAGYVTIGSPERAGGGRIADPVRSKHQGAEGLQSQGRRQIGRRHRLAGVHWSIVEVRRGEPVGVLGSCTQPLASAYDVAMLDLDGVVYIGGGPVPGAAEAITQARDLGQQIAFITNNASRSPEQAAEKIRGAGVAAEADEVVTSAQAAARVLVADFGAGARVATLGADGLREALTAVGLVPVDVGDEDAIALATGYGPQVLWHEVMHAGVRVRAGLPWVATNTDSTIPTPFGTAPGHGVLVDMLRRFSNREPKVAGKPERPLFDETLQRTGAEHPLMVGDRLDTDIEGATLAGIDSLLVMTGVTDLAELVAAPKQMRPTYLAADLEGLVTPHLPPEPKAGGWETDGWRVTAVDGRLVVTAGPRSMGSGDIHDWWRTVAVAAWDLLDAEGSTADVSGVGLPR